MSAVLAVLSFLVSIPIITFANGLLNVDRALSNFSVSIFFITSLNYINSMITVKIILKPLFEKPHHEWYVCLEYLLDLKLIELWGMK